MTLRQVFSAFLIFSLLAGVAAAREEKAPQPSPPLWRVSDGDSAVFLFGAYSVVPAGAAWRSRAVAAAIDASDALWFEAPAEDPRSRDIANRIFEEEGKLPKGKTLSALLGTEHAARLGVIAMEAGLPPAMLDGLKPWAAFLVLSGKTDANIGVPLAESVDAALLREADGRGREVRHLASVESSLRVLTAMPEGEAAELLGFLVEDWPRRRKDAAATFERWRMGDMAAVDEHLNAGLRAEAPAAFQRLVAGRNAAFAERIAGLLAENAAAFIALDAGYLAGEGALPAELFAGGFKVERIGPAP